MPSAAGATHSTSHDGMAGVSLDQTAIASLPEPAKIRTKALNVFYGKAQALHDISIELPERQVTALMGPSGCGKSTFLRALNRMHDLTPNVTITGQVTLAGENILSPVVDVVRLRQRVGMVFQRPNVFPRSIFENVAYGLRVQGGQTRHVIQERVERSLMGAALWNEVHDRLNQSALGLSGGQQQRLCIARALAVEPEVILMDEPCSALDPIATLKIEELIKSLSATYTIVIVTHNLQQAARVSNYTGFFLQGRLIEYAPTEQLFSRPQLAATEGFITGRFG
ncbi:MAG TPA: phosphate ABC transporter ATP-binding protein PstB [Ktedonobacterales bacterium]|nr:phosphate ABC transporter ATP-binding protein PstB [Ktedonobacterales bacterium]